ncbi:hypothetical protein [Imtechella halotolerans]|uniref:Uncharacterized protein n=1 Tax=Imtechella halotolerans K1 TaxID=946077 RepID=I0W7R6_9FLAO|nr:hypothetical protein [Imtechella halotolerans]EID72432.1 hypothetical protein W5A_13031 [Imtechella halotolerans K1]WMQ64533.1 hypothetical protein PT603_06000 [Imtechella halotolerans]
MGNNTVKQLILGLLLLLMCPLSSYAQVETYEANYMIIEPSGNQDATKKQFADLIEIVKENYSSRNLFSHQSPFVIVPSIKIISEKIAGEIQVVKVVKLEIGLTVQGKDDDYVFHKFKHIYTITAEDAQGAISKAIRSIAKEPKLKTFFKESNKNIVDFYESNCATILSTVKVNIERQEYAKAFDYLRYVPETVSCYKESEKIITKIYLESKEENCKRLVQKAHAAEANREYKKALHYLQFVEPTVACYNSAAELTNKISGRLDEKVLRDFEMEKLTFSKLSDLKKMEIIAKEIDSVNVVINE